MPSFLRLQPELYKPADGFGSFDRMVDQTKSTQVCGWPIHDGELDSRPSETFR
jgi:hypothetical protein